MIELHNNQLIFRFPKVHPSAECRIDFQRTLRIPDDNRDYPLPPGLGKFPVTHVDDYSEKLPVTWQRCGGVFIPMYQSEALWVNFGGNDPFASIAAACLVTYPCAVKIAAGKINAVSGKPWDNRLSADPQDYVVAPNQPWLDGFNVAEGYVRQFVAMPLGTGYTAEEQIAGQAETGGLQVIVYPMKKYVYDDSVTRLYKRSLGSDEILFSRVHSDSESPDMGLAPGGLMRQKIYEDEYGIDAWDQDNGFRCFIHLANSEMYQAITGHVPPHKPLTAKDYTQSGLPWFDYYSDGKALSGTKPLSTLTSVATKIIQKDGVPLKDNASVQPQLIKKLGSSSAVRDGEY
jgi:hypothetical protein